MYAERDIILAFSCCSCAAEHCRGAVFLYTTGITARLSQSSVHPITGHEFSYGQYDVFLFGEILHHILPMCWSLNTTTGHQEKLDLKLVSFRIFPPLVFISYQFRIPGCDLIFNWLLPFLACPLNVLEKILRRFWQGPAKQSRSSPYQFRIHHNAECGVLFGCIFFCSFLF